MKHLVLTLVASLIAACGSIDEGPFVTGPGEDPVEEMPGTLSVRNLATGLDTPWDIAMGPDGVIWVTERRGVVSRVDTASGLVTQVGTVDAVEQSESGLLGLALHPDFPSSPWVYLAYSYSASGFTQKPSRPSPLERYGLGPGRDPARPDPRCTQTTMAHG